MPRVHFFEDSGHCPKILDYTLDYGYRVVDIDRYIDRYRYRYKHNHLKNYGQTTLIRRFSGNLNLPPFLLFAFHLFIHIKIYVYIPSYIWR